MLQNMYRLRHHKLALYLAVIRVGSTSSSGACGLVIAVADVLPRIDTPQRLHPVHILSPWARLWSLRYDNVVSLLDTFRRQSKVEAARGWPLIGCGST